MKKYVVGATFSDEVSNREIENKRVAYEAALEGIVLLKNNNSLPIAKGKIALYGVGANLTVKGGTGSGEVNERHSITILEGLKKAGFEITTTNWLDDAMKEYEAAVKKYSDDFKKLSLIEMFNSMNLVEPFRFPYGRLITDEDIKNSDTDVAIYVVARQAGEGSDKKIENGEFDLAEVEIENIRILKKNYKNTIVVINSGAFMNISTLEEIDVSSIIFFCQQGSEGGAAFADIVSGKISPSGKLADTWVKSYNDIPFGDDYSYRSGDTTQEYYKEGIYVGYRYADSFNVKPRYAFGFGLSYTNFDLKCSNQKIESDVFSMDVEVSNIGNHNGKEVVEIYVSCPNGKLVKEYQRLVAFKKTKLLQPGEKELLHLSFDMNYCSSYDEKNASYILEAGNYLVRCGNSSDNTKVVANVVLNKNIVVSKVKNICPVTKDFMEIESPKLNTNEIDDNAPIINYEQSRITLEVKYKEAEIYHDPKVDEIVHSLSTKEMVDVCVGTGFLGMVNVDYVACAGAVARTTDKFISRGLINANFCDGPAGLRILKRCAIADRGIIKLKLIDYMLGFMNYFPNWIKKFLGPNKKQKVRYQFATAFPVGTSLAQTWNQELVEKVGKAISVEMDEFNCMYWLAPAMNIHRNPLCGRNFEYYSEDPVLTGKIASSIIKGVQSLDGNHATIKHFACNNQEDNRTKSNSNVHERALREIYLRGFEIAVKESQPKSVMTSYNLVNGVYTSNSYDLVNEVLRNEWGFDGVVMTDWYSTGIEAGTKVQLGRDDLALAIGNDLIMPGGGANKKVILKGLKNATVTREQIERSTANVVRQIVYSRLNQKYPPETFVKQKSK